MRAYDSIIVAKYIIAKARDLGRNLNVTQTQKLLYLAYGFGLKYYHVPIIDESPRAWPYGPVFPNTRESIDFSKIYDVNHQCFSNIKSNADLLKLLDSVVQKYSDSSASKLSSWSHNDGGPWDKTTKKKGFQWNDKIDDALISDYFKKYYLYEPV